MEQEIGARYGVAVHPRDAETIKKVLKDIGAQDPEARTIRIGRAVVFPINESSFHRVHDLLHSFRAGIIEAAFPVTRRETLRSLVAKRLGEDIASRVPRSYDVVGDVALLPLPEDLLRYGKEIGEALMMLHRNVRAVYARGTTTGEERVRQLVHLAGEHRTTTIYREHGLRFYVDVARVYVNPSLSEEHVRIASMIKDGSSVLDMFAGIGFFSLHIAARKRCKTITACDINPYALYCFNRSVELNKAKLKSSIMFIKCDAKLLTTILSENSFDVIIMNLPHKALDFVDIACSLAKKDAILVMYTIARDPEEAAQKAVGKGLIVDAVRRVLDYAPFKYVYALHCRPSRQ